MHKLMVGIIAAMLGMAVLTSNEASAQGRWHGGRGHHSWHHRGWHHGGGWHRGGWGHHRRCTRHWVGGRLVTRCW